MGLNCPSLLLAYNAGAALLQIRSPALSLGTEEMLATAIAPPLGNDATTVLLLSIQLARTGRIQSHNHIRVGW
jgi:hypothetical protein